MTNETKEKRSKIPYIFVAFFAVIFIVNFLYIYVANKTWRGVFTEDSYQKGLHYNQTIQEAAKQKEIGWAMNIKYQPLSKTKGTILISLRDKQGTPINDATIQADFKRPTQDGFDFVQNINFIDGVYQADVTFPLKGQWDVQLTAVRDGGMYREVKRFIVQ